MSSSHQVASPLDAIITQALDTVDPSWHSGLSSAHPHIVNCLQRAASLSGEGQRVLPDPQQVLRALHTPLTAVRVLIVGQDPYPTIGHPVGLSFAVNRQVRPLPRSLANIYQELHADLGIPPAEHGDLSAWARRGVLLLNRVLTVTAGQSGSHAKTGWEEVTEQVVRVLVSRGGPLVAILWGKQAQSLQPLLGEVPTICSAHPSPLSASRGFWGSKPFSRANDMLVAQGGEPIDWTVT